MRDPKPARLRRVLGLLALTAGAALAIQAAAVRAGGAAWQELHKGIQVAPVPGVGEALARLRIRRLGIDAEVTEGTDPVSLRLGPGHMPGSALPGEADNCIIAGHRDGAFHRLVAVRAGDVVEIEAPSGVSRYRVWDVEVVKKDDTRPLAPSRRAELTLVTCYPIHYVGPAPGRLVVRGELVEDERNL